MKEFCYTIKNAVGVHARPAGALARMAEKYESSMTIEKDGTAVDLEKLIAVMKLNVLCNETVKVTADGSDEEEAIESVRAYFENNL